MLAYRTGGLRLRGIVQVAASMLVLTACGQPAGPGVCFGSVDLSVAEGTLPEFTWDPPCSLTSLAVFDAGGGVMWAIGGGVGESTLFPPVRYGVVPAGMTETTSSQPLQAGYGYRVRVFRLEVQDGALRLLQAGEVTFRE